MKSWHLFVCMSAWAAARAVAETPPPLPAAPIAAAIERYQQNDIDLRDLIVSPDRAVAVVRRRPPLSAIADRAEPSLRLGAFAVYPASRRMRAMDIDPLFTGLTLIQIAERRAIPVSLPEGSRVSEVLWSPDGKHLACLVHRRLQPAQVWAIDPRTGAARPLSPASVNAYDITPLQWAGNDRLLVRMIVQDTGPPPVATIRTEAQVKDSSVGVVGRAASNYRHWMLPDEQARDTYRYYAASELWSIGLDGRRRSLGIRGVFRPQSSPDGKFVLVTFPLEPFQFPAIVDFAGVRKELYTAGGKHLTTVVERFVQTEDSDSRESTGATSLGRRNVHWRSDEPATLAWTSAVEEKQGESAPVRDELWQWRAPFAAPPVLIYRTAWRLGEILWSDASAALVSEAWPKTGVRPHFRRIDPGRPLQAGIAFGPPAEGETNKVSRPLRNPEGRWQRGSDNSYEYVYGNVPRRFAATGSPERLWTEEAGTRERWVAFIDPQQRKALTAREVDGRPELCERDLASRRIETVYRPRHELFVPPSLVREEKIRFRRPDGVEFSGSLFVPAGWKKEDGPLPTFMWVYLSERKIEDYGKYRDSTGAKAASEANPTGDMRELALLGYAVLSAQQLPIIDRNGQAPQDTLLPQLIEDVTAVVDGLVARGVSDRAHIAVGGHSYGGFTTAHLLAQTRLFRAGVASSGLYYLALSPFGKQVETRTLWEAPETYTRNSPLMSADRVEAPLLMLHGEEDIHTHIDEARMYYDALSNLGKRVRMVTFPFEQHTYGTKESMLRIQAEIAAWLEKYLRKP